MGFETNLLIVTDQRWAHEDSPAILPEEASLPGWKPKVLGEGSLWRISGIVSIGRTTRLGKITEDCYRHLREGYRGRGTAAICAVDQLWQDVIPGAIDRLEFAPPFAVFEHGNTYAGICDLFRDGKIPDGAAFVAPTYLSSPFDRADETAPSSRVIGEHNAAVQLPPEELAALAQKYRVIDQGPLIWSSVDALADSLGKLLSGNGEASVALRRDLAATAIVESWRGYLAPLAKIGARAIFDFEHLRTPELA